MAKKWLLIFNLLAIVAALLCIPCFFEFSKTHTMSPRDIEGPSNPKDSIYWGCFCGTGFFFFIFSFIGLYAEHPYLKRACIVSLVAMGSILLTPLLAYGLVVLSMFTKFTVSEGLFFALFDYLFILPSLVPSVFFVIAVLKITCDILYSRTPTMDKVCMSFFGTITLILNVYLFLFLQQRLFPDWFC